MGFNTEVGFIFSVGHMYREMVFLSFPQRYRIPLSIVSTLGFVQYYTVTLSANVRDVALESVTSLIVI